MPRSIWAILMLNALGNIWYIVQLHHKQRRKKRLPLKPGKKKARVRQKGRRVTVFYLITGMSAQLAPLSTVKL